MFGKLFARKDEPQGFSGIKEVRAKWGSAFHLITSDAWTDLMEGETLCGYKSWLRSARTEDVVLNEVLADAEKKFDSWHYCADCIKVIRELVAD